MDSLTILPGLTLDDLMYESVSWQVHHIEPRPVISWGMFTDPERWCLVPAPDASAYKAEMLVERNESRTIKVNLWFAPDLRDGARPMPHSHPWEFTSYILEGGYREDRYTRTPAGVRKETREHRASGALDFPTTNEIALYEFHEVTEIFAPGRTLTLMVCGEWDPDGWEYLDPETGTPIDRHGHS